MSPFFIFCFALSFLLTSLFYSYRIFLEAGVSRFEVSKPLQAALKCKTLDFRLWVGRQQNKGYLNMLHYFCLSSFELLIRLSSR